MTTKVAGRIATAGVVLALTTIGSRAEEIQLPTFDVVATTPLGGGEINVAQSPFAVWQTQLPGHSNLQRYDPHRARWRARRRESPSATSPATTSSQTSSIEASTRPRSPARRKGWPSIRTACASTRRSATTVNWDLIPANAIDKTTIIAANPIFGLNALGGAVTVTMKNGFTWQGFEADSRGGSFVRAQEEIQYGKQVRQLVGLRGGESDQRRRLAGRRSVADHQFLWRRRLQGERV